MLSVAGQRREFPRQSSHSRQVDVVMVRDLLKAGEPVLLGVGSLPEAVHDVDDFVVCDARYIE